MASNFADFDFGDRQYTSPYAPSFEALSAFRNALHPTFSQSPWSTLTDDPAEQLSLLPLPFFNHRSLAENMDSLIYNRVPSPSDLGSTPSASVNSQQAQFSPSPPSHAARRAELYIYPEPADPFIDINFDGDDEDEYPPQSPQSNMTRDSSVVDLTAESPVQRKRKRKSAQESSEPSTKRHKSYSDSASKPSHQGIEEVNLVDVENDEEYAEFRRKQQADLIKQQQKDDADRPVKLAAYQCSICLDSPTDLVVTHCGHMFCSFCLHEALNAATVKRACPICRAPVGMPKAKKDGEKTLGKIFFPLEMKLMTKKRKGKLPQWP